MHGRQHGEVVVRSTCHIDLVLIQAYLILLCFEVFWQLCIKQVYWCHFVPIAFAHFMTPCHILVIFTICQTFSLLLHLIW